MQTTAENTAFAPLTPAGQMAADATEHMTEAEQLILAISIINQARQPASMRALQRASAMALATARDIQSSRMADRLSPASRIDPVFWRAFLSFYNAPDQPSISTSYRHTCLLVAHDQTDCIVASEHQIRHALSDLHCATSAGAQIRRNT